MCEEAVCDWRSLSFNKAGKNIIQIYKSLIAEEYVFFEVFWKEQQFLALSTLFKVQVHKIIFINKIMVSRVTNRALVVNRKKIKEMDFVGANLAE